MGASQGKLHVNSNFITIGYIQAKDKIKTNGGWELNGH